MSVRNGPEWVSGINRNDCPDWIGIGVRIGPEYAPWLRQAKSKNFELVIASHTLAELYAVLSTLPIKPRISPAVAWRLVNENIVAISKVVSLTPGEYSDVIKRISESGLIGGIVYDALIAKVAQKAKVQRLLTFNSEHFKRVWPTGEHMILNP